MKGTMCNIYVEGLNIERFIRKAAGAGIRLDRMKRNTRGLYAQVYEADLQMIREAADQGGWRLTVGRRTGIGRVMDAGRMHRGFIYSLIACAALLIVALQLVWQVDISGEAVYCADAQRFLHENGIHAFVWRCKIDLAQLRDMLEWRYPEVAWVDCGWRGNSLRVELVKGVAVGETVQKDGSGDVIACRSGVVEQIITLAGTAAVRPGDVVQQGQVLIQGTERGVNEESLAVMARGIVMARVWDHASVQMNITETVTEYSGKEQEAWQVNCPWFSLWRTNDIAYDMQDSTREIQPLGGLFFPFSLEKVCIREAKSVKRTRSMKEMKEEAGKAAIRALQNKTGFYDELVDKWVDYCMIEDEVLCANAYGERVIDIAQARRNTP